MNDNYNNKDLSHQKDNRYNDYPYDSETGDEDNLYSLPEDEDDTFSEDGFERYPEDSENEEENVENDDEDEEEAEEDEEDLNREKGNVTALLFKILSTPVEGWKELKRRKYAPEKIVMGCFLPMVFLAGLSEFAVKIYGNYITIGECMLRFLITILSYFFGYFTCILLSGIFLPKASRNAIKSETGKNFVMINISSLALFLAVQNFCPMLDAVLVFLPIWTIYIIYKGVRFLRVPIAVEGRTKVILIFLIIGSPFLWEWLMSNFFLL